jgi:uncharacterized C2H2 Zn-finger protein
MPTIAKDVEDKIVRKAGSNCPRCGMVCVDVQGYISFHDMETLMRE